MGATLSSETTAAATGEVGVVRRDPMAMLPFIGYNAGDYFSHWIEMGKDADAVKLPKIFYVNWFRRDDGRRLPLARLRRERPRPQVGHRAHRGHAPPRSRPPIGLVPTAESLDVDGLDMTAEQLEAALAVDPDEWREEIPQIQEWFEKIGTDKVPAMLMDRARRSPRPPRRPLTRSLLPASPLPLGRLITLT